MDDWFKKSLSPVQYKPFSGMWNAFRARDFVLKLGLQPHNFTTDIATLARVAKVEEKHVLYEIHPLTYARDIMHLPEFHQRALLGKKDYEELEKIKIVAQAKQ